MDAYFLVLAVLPFFLGIMLLEHLYFLRKGTPVYDKSDTLVNLACGFGQALTDSLFKVLLLWLYLALQRFFQIELIAKSLPTYILCFFFLDLSYYTYHRMSHRVNLMWAIHIVHHSSSHYNYSVALRQAWFQKLTAFPFYLIFLFFGMPVEILAVTIAAHALLQFFSHTQAFKKEIPWVRWIFVTPSFHRVHHGINRPYIDKNYGGIFSFWDRLFGTYQPETETVRFGIYPQLNEQSAWVANTHGLKELFADFNQTKSWKEKWALLWAPPLQKHTRQYSVKSTKITLHLLTFAVILFYLFRWDSSPWIWEIGVLFLASAFLLWFAGRTQKVS
ncbi:MAG: sterol desaturase family protein [Bdellovibrionales bacterium]|nr:sterol desaturase family protein [Bdellovibrionales bacterium]